MMAKINISIPDEVLHRVEEASKKLGLSRSAYLTMAASEKMKQEEALSTMQKFVDQMKNMSASVLESKISASILEAKEKENQ